MICLDTNFLIRALVPSSVEGTRILHWLGQGEPIGIPAIAWYEFLCGPLGPEEIQLASAITTAGILPFGEREAEGAARLFNAVNRNRRMRVDAMIAATAIASSARVATLNHKDFEPFVVHGLRVA